MSKSMKEGHHASGHYKMKSMEAESHHNAAASERERKSGEMRKLMTKMVGKITEHK